MKILSTYLTRIEGDVKLHIEFEESKVKDVRLSVPTYRGIDRVLIGRPYMDALVITPRVCGICGHAHLIASVKAIESAMGGVNLTEKATMVREITLLCEHLQNHIKWLYLFLMPDMVEENEKLLELYAPFRGARWKRGVEAAKYVVKISALFGGQWPHSSYAVPGGITSRPKPKDILDALLFLKKAQECLETLDEEEKIFMDFCFSRGLESRGRSHGRFFAMGTLLKKKETCAFNIKYVKQKDRYSYFSKNPDAYSWAMAVRYRGLPFEVGPLARQLLEKDPYITSLYSKYLDSFMVRCLARFVEIRKLFVKIRNLLEKLEGLIWQESWIKPHVDQNFSGKGFSLLEAPRGVLIHRIDIEKGRIRAYEMITPSDWNLGPRCEHHLGVAEKALFEALDEREAMLILRSFDTCSVCASH